MGFVRYLAVLPFLGILVGVPCFNRVEPLTLCMPLNLAWIVPWIILTSAIAMLLPNLPATGVVSALTRRPAAHA